LPHEAFELAALARVLPLSLIREALEAAGKQGERRRKLPPELVTWLLIGMGLFRDLSIPNVLKRVVDGLAGVVSWGRAEVPCSTSIAHARDRLGWETVREIFRRLAEVLLGKHSDATTWRGLVVYALDGVCFLTPDRPENDAAFGRAGVTRGGAKSGFPQLRGVLLVAAWTHVVVRAVFGPFRKGELTLAHELVPQLPAGALLLMDRAYYSFAWLNALVDQNVRFVVRARTNGHVLTPRITKRFTRNDALAELNVPESAKRKNPALPALLRVRVIRYTVKGYRPITLVTDLLDPRLYSAKSLSELYHDRWEAELSYRELKTYQIAERVTFRSHTAERVLQEVYGLLLAYNCVRSLMADAAIVAGVQARSLSFVSCLERIRVALPLLAAAATPDECARLLDALVDDLARCVLPPRRAGRQCPRAVKIKMSNYPRKRPGSQVVARTR
jgi:Insertion element 4 transposase N-terminal/Transposase DDE domain